MRASIARLGGIPARGRLERRAAEPLPDPFASGELIEERAGPIPVNPPTTAPDGVGFLDGVQRFVIDGYLGAAPVVRAWVGAAVLVRRAGALRPVASVTEELLVVPDRIGPSARAELASCGVTVFPSEASDRAHPTVDRYEAVRVVERRRACAEQAAAEEFLRVHTGWLFVDGVPGRIDAPANGLVVGVVKRHETQFLSGEELDAALQLPEGTRTPIFARRADGQHPAFTWYLRLWPWAGEHLIHGLIRLEVRDRDVALASADELSRHVLAERVPVSAPDARWDRLIYPIHEVESYLRARLGGWG